MVITGGGEINAGGGWWWCVRMNAAKQPGGGHSPAWCPQMVKEKKIPGFTLVPPRMLHMVGSDNIVLHNMTITNSPYWTLHFQYCDNVTISHTTVFNPNNGQSDNPVTPFLPRICSRTLMDAVACCPLFLLTRAVLMTSSHSKAALKPRTGTGLIWTPRPTCTCTTA